MDKDSDIEELREDLKVIRKTLKNKDLNYEDFSNIKKKLSNDLKIVNKLIKTVKAPEPKKK